MRAGGGSPLDAHLTRLRTSDAGHPPRKDPLERGTALGFDAAGEGFQVGSSPLRVVGGPNLTLGAMPP